MKIAVQGLWHLGSVTAAALASVGHEVVGLDFGEPVVKRLQMGKAPILEIGLDDLIHDGLQSNRLTFISDPSLLPQDIEILWVTYDTPVDEEDVADIDYVIDKITVTMSFLPKETTVLVSSQMPVGSIRDLEMIAKTKHSEKRLGFACSPENLRLGKSLDVFLKPDRIIVGTRLERDKARIEKMLLPITTRLEWMSIESAEMTKHAINAFLATSVVFANEIATLCEMVGADAKEVERGLKTEQRIGPKAYLSPGGAFAGGTLARDIEFLKVISQKAKLDIPLLESVKISNDFHKSWAKRKLKLLFQNLTGVGVTVWGLTYKPGTDTLRRSLAVELCNWLLDQGAHVRVHDPVVKELPDNWNGFIQRFDNALDALTGSQVLIVGTEWPDYKALALDDFVRKAAGLVVLDQNRFLWVFSDIESLRYFAVGTIPEERLL